MVNIFFLDLNPEKCAKYYNDKHILKIPIEITQVLSKVLHHYKKEGIININVSRIYVDSKMISQSSNLFLWMLKENNFSYCLNLAIELIKEYKYRYNKRNHKTEIPLKYIEEVFKKNKNIFRKNQNKNLSFPIINKYLYYELLSKNPIKIARYHYTELKYFKGKYKKKNIPH